MLGIALQQTRVYQEAKEEGRQAERQSLLQLLLAQKFGELPSVLHDRIVQLNPSQLEALAIALLNFDSIANLEAWLNENS